MYVKEELLKGNISWKKVDQAAVYSLRDNWLLLYYTENAGAYIQWWSNNALFYQVEQLTQAGKSCHHLHRI